MVGIGFKQFKRTYPGGYNLNFPICLSASNDFKVKNYTNFYLTTSQRFGECFEVASETLKANNILTTIQYGQDYLKFSDIDPTPYASQDRYIDNFNYGAASFTSVEGEDTLFTITIMDNNQCQIYFLKNYKKYYLCSDENANLAFVKEKLLNFDESTTNSQDFRYMFSEDENYIFIFQRKATGDYFLSKLNNSLNLVLLTDINIIDNISNPFKISRSLYTRPNISLDSSFITYDGSNNIDMDKSRFDLSNNFLLHKRYTEETSTTDVIVLKNQLLQNNVFSSANNLLSSNENQLFVDGLRDYSNILEDIREEKTDSLELNYVFYNKPYTIKPGSNIFVSPSSMYPFTRLNINDTKFVDGGSFSYSTPEYADKVYHLSKDVKNYDAGQYLLCTWLSGAPLSPNKVWVDRYYYPDLIEKSAALSASPMFNVTYDDVIEQLILDNSSISTNLQKTKFFDKMSDLAFEPNEKYDYRRIMVSEFPTISQTISQCSSFTSDYPQNYFSKLNSSGMFTLGLYFNGDDASWVVRSDRNNIDSGLTITKSGKTIDIEMKFFDPSNGTYTTFQTSQEIKDLKENFVCVSIDTFKGIGYVFLNNSVVLLIDLPLGQFYKKLLLYGDFFLIAGETRTNILNATTIINKSFVLDVFVDSDMVFILPIIDGRMKIDDLYLTLPCGMRNSIDDVDYLQSICGSSAFKSNDFNIIIKNLNITNPNVLKGIKESITTSLKNVMSVTSSINNIEFETYQ